MWLKAIIQHKLHRNLPMQVIVMEEWCTTSQIPKKNNDFEDNSWVVRINLSLPLYKI